MENKLLFAPLVRVSTEKQAKKGESLATQKKQLESIIKSLNGNVYHWYAGQEHATPNHERAILQKLIRDAEEKKFHAVIVTDLSRWSRDNAQSKEYLEILKRHGIRFFVGTKEINFNLPSDTFLLGMHVEIAEYFANEQSFKSITNRIERAKKGYPTSGKLPYGRKFNSQAGEWEIIPEAKKRITEIAEQYLEGNVPFLALGKKYGMNPTNIHKILTKRCGDTWEVEFADKRFGINEKVKIKVPRLLPESTIQRLRKKCEARRTWEHGAYKYCYLFSRIIFDKGTGYALTGTPNSKGQRYYKPYGGRQDRYMVNADVLEEAVTDTFFEALGNNAILLEAVFEGNSRTQNAEVLKDKIATYEKELKQNEKKISNIHDAITNFGGDDIAGFIGQLRDTVKKLDEERSKLIFKINTSTNQLEASPTEEEIESRRKKMRDDIARITEIGYFREGYAFRDMSFEDRQKIIKLVFGGKDENGKKYGIYIQPLHGKPKKYSFEAYGKLGTIYGQLSSNPRMSDSEDPYNSIITNENDCLFKDISKIVKNAEMLPNYQADEDKSTYPCYLPEQVPR